MQYRLEAMVCFFTIIQRADRKSRYEGTIAGLARIGTTFGISNLTKSYPGGKAVVGALR